MKSGGAHVSNSYYSNPGLLYTMYILRFHMMIKMYDQQREIERGGGERKRDI